jgi:hypothetical protein
MVLAKIQRQMVVGSKPVHSRYRQLQMTFEEIETLARRMGNKPRLEIQFGRIDEGVRVTLEVASHTIRVSADTIDEALQHIANRISTMHERQP